MNEERRESKTMRRPLGRGAALASVALLVIAVGTAVYKYVNVKNSISDEAENVSAENQIPDDDISLSFNPADDATVADETPTISTNPSVSTVSSISAETVSDTTSTNSDTTVTPAEDPTPSNPPSDDEKPTISSGLLITNFDDDSIANWIGDAISVADDTFSGKTLKLSNIAGWSTSAKRIFESPILKGYKNLEFDINTSGREFGTGDASAVTFEQNGEWKWISLSDYADSTSGTNPAESTSGASWQHISIPLSDFYGLDTDKSVAYLQFRFWDENAGDYYLDNIYLTGKTETTLDRPTGLSGSVISDTQIDLSWSGTSSSFNVYENGNQVATVAESNYSAINLDPSTAYSFYVTATDGTTESTPSDTVLKTTLPPIIPPFVLSDFEDGTLADWIGGGIISAGYNSANGLELIIPENDSVTINKILDSAILAGHKKLEFDINLNGNYLFDEAAEVTFDQSGWRTVSILNYVENGADGWQHVSIPLSDFTDLNTDEGVAQMIYHFWSANEAQINLDNIILK